MGIENVPQVHQGAKRKLLATGGLECRVSKKKGEKPSAAGIKILVKNKKAFFQYHILETFEAGMVLTGGEIKSIREGKITLAESYVVVRGGEVWLRQAHIAQYRFDTDPQYDPVRPRKLLLHRHEIDKLRGRIEKKGLTAIPTKIYLKRGYAKIEFALAQGKDAPDKRQTIKEREGKREAQRAIKTKGY
jgi:SsrA-binding protein